MNFFKIVRGSTMTLLTLLFGCNRATDPNPDPTPSGNSTPVAQNKSTPGSQSTAPTVQGETAVTPSSRLTPDLERRV